MQLAWDKAAKRRITRYFGLEINPNVLVVGMSMRIVWQKNIDLALAALIWLIGKQ